MQAGSTDWGHYTLAPSRLDTSQGQKFYPVLGIRGYHGELKSRLALSLGIRNTPAPMSFWTQLALTTTTHQSLLCVGLDPDPTCLPADFGSLTGSSLAPLLTWNRHIISRTADWACAYKPNLGFYLRHGAPGLQLLADTVAAIPAATPVILDAKFGDIGSTAAGYAHFAFAELGVGAVTLNPLLGQDSLAPFFAYPDKGFWLLAHTSNPDARQFQDLETGSGPLHERIAATVQTWEPRVGLVVGATYPEQLRRIRELVPDRWILAPGLGRQGGALAASLAAGWSTARPPGLLFNASSGLARAQDPGKAAQEIVESMRQTAMQMTETTA